MKYCPSCDIELGDPKQNFCENCGFRLLQTQKEENFVRANRDLFNLSQEYYILKKDYWIDGSGYVFDIQVKPIGYIDGNKKKKIKIKKLDNTIAATVLFKSRSFRGASELLDQNGNLIMKLTKKKISDFKAIYYLENQKGIRLFRAFGEFITFQFLIEDLLRNKVVAECNKIEKWRENLSGNLDYKNDYALKILDEYTDRRILLLFVIGIRQIRFLRMF